MALPKETIDSAKSNTAGTGARGYPVHRRGSGNDHADGIDQIAEEVAVAMVYNGISHAVMMATPVNLEDFALGFSLTEGIIDSVDQLRSVEIERSELGYQVIMEIASSAFMNLKQRRRQLSGRTGCGICGLESLEAVMPNVKKVLVANIPDFAAIERASIEMLKAQTLQQQCGSVHAAAFANMQGEVLLVREDVGRHNALDKLLGALAKQAPQEGFVLVSSRASYEMVAKLASQGFATLASISAPTSLAIDLAKKANMNLIGFVRPGRQQIYASQQAE